MADPTRIEEEYFEILAVRELRKIGLGLPSVRVVRRAAVAEEDGGGYEFALTGTFQHGEQRIPVRIEGLAHRRAVSVGTLKRVVERVAEAEPPRAGVVFATVEYEPEALQLAETEGLALLRVVDGRAAFAASGWGVASQYPSWLPEFTAQLVTRTPWGEPRYEALEAGRPEPVLDRLRPPGRAAGADDASDGGGSGAGAPRPDGSPPAA